MREWEQKGREAVSVCVVVGGDTVPPEFSVIQLVPRTPVLNLQSLHEGPLPQHNSGGNSSDTTPRLEKG